MNLDSFTITILFILITTLIAAFVQRCKRDKCIKDFKSYPVNIEKIGKGKVAGGILFMQTTGLELVYQTPQKDEFDFVNNSYLFYKYEYPQIQAIIRYLDELDAQQMLNRQKRLWRIYHPTALRRFRRGVLGVFKTLRDSITEVINVALSFAQKSKTAGAMLTSQNKYVTQMKQELLESVGTAHEPLLEKYIGKKVVFELIKGEIFYKYRGILKEYTANFIELIDVDYYERKEDTPRRADIIIPQKYGIIRHLAGE